MGTRHLTCVFVDGDWKVAQYGQWDGYPSGQGVDVLAFLQNADLNMFRKALENVRWITEEELVSEWEECGADDTEWVSMEVADAHKRAYPENSRDTGAEILNLIYNFVPSESKPVLKIRKDIEFASHSLFCEWAYVIDLDKNVLEVYTGFNKKPLGKTQRFRNFPIEPKGDYKGATQYYPIRLKRSYPLALLPTQDIFLKELDRE